MDKQLIKLNEEAMTLMEVLVALVIMSILTMAFLPAFSTASNWITGAGKRTIARDYASSTIELIRANSIDLSKVVMAVGADPDNLLDVAYCKSQSLSPGDKFTFKLDPSKADLEVDVPSGMTAMGVTGIKLKIMKHLETGYYSAGMTRVINNNLFNVIVTVTWKQGGFDKELQMSTVIAAR